MSNPPRPTLPMPPGLFRLFMGDGRTKLNPKAMCWHEEWVSPPCYAFRNSVPVYVAGMKYALPPLPRRKSAREAREKFILSLSLIENVPDTTFRAGMMVGIRAGWNAAMREAKKGGAG